MDEKEKAQMIAEALSGLTYSEWQAVRSVIDAIFGKRAEKTLDALSLANTDIEHLGPRIYRSLIKEPSERIRF